MSAKKLLSVASSIAAAFIVSTTLTGFKLPDVESIVSKAGALVKSEPTCNLPIWKCKDPNCQVHAKERAKQEAKKKAEQAAGPDYSQCNSSLPVWKLPKYCEDLKPCKVPCDKHGKRAKVSLKFTLSTKLGGNYFIKKGTSVGFGACSFDTDKDLVIKSGALSGTVSATSTFAGAECNNIKIGTVGGAPMKFMQEVRTVSAATGGTDSGKDCRK